jgi:two-component system response regulator (stage 0 sporulation protein A)
MAESPLGIVVIDDNESMTNLLSSLLEDMAQFTVLGQAYDGKTGIDLITETKPDIVVLDLCMPYIDGLGVMEAFQPTKDSYFPYFIITTCLGQEHITSMAMKLGAAYYMIKPLDYNYFTTRLTEIASEINNKTMTVHMDTARNPAAMEKVAVNSQMGRVSELLHELGVPPHTKGYAYIKDAISFVLQDVRYMSKITKNLYPEIAEMHDATPSRVERAIRNSIELTLVHGDPVALSKYFGHRIKGTNSKLTNSEFIAILSEKLKVGN